MRIRRRGLVWCQGRSDRSTYSDGVQYMNVDIQRSLVYTRWQGRIETLRESLRDHELVWYVCEVRIRLQALFKCTQEEAISGL